MLKRLKGRGQQSFLIVLQTWSLSTTVSLFIPSFISVCILLTGFLLSITQSYINFLTKSFFQKDTSLQFPRIQKYLACKYILTLVIGLFRRDALKVYDTKFYAFDT